MKIRKILAILISFYLVLLFWTLNFGFATLDTFFNKDFYNDDFTEFVYLQSRELILSEFDKQSNAVSDILISKEDFSQVLDQYYSAYDVEDIRDQFVVNIDSYEPGQSFIISLESLKSDFEKIVDDLAVRAGSDFVSYYIKSTVDFYEYLPNEIDLAANIQNPDALSFVQALFDKQLIFKVVWIAFFAILFALSILIWPGGGLSRLKFSSISLLLISAVNLAFVLAFFHLSKLFFIENFPIKMINNMNIDIGVQLYNLFIEPLFIHLIYFLSGGLLISGVLYLFYRVKKTDQVI